MVSAVGNSNVVPLRAPEREPQLDPLTEKRAEQGRQLALAAMRADHAQKVQVAVEAYANFYAQDSSSPTAALGQAQQTYGEF